MHDIDRDSPKKTVQSTAPGTKSTPYAPQQKQAEDVQKKEPLNQPKETQRPPNNQKEN